MISNQNRFGRRGFTSNSPSSTSIANYGNSSMSRGTFMRGLGLAGAGVAAGMMGLSGVARAQTTTFSTNDIIADINGENIYNMVATLSDTSGLGANGRYAGVNQDVEEYIKDYFQSCGLSYGFDSDLDGVNDSYYHPFDYHFTKCNSVKFQVLNSNGESPLLPKLKGDINDPHFWTDLSGNPYILPLYDDEGNKVVENWEQRQPIVGVDYFVKLRAGPVNNLTGAGFVPEYFPGNNFSGKIVLNDSRYPSAKGIGVGTSQTFNACLQAYNKGAVGFIGRSARIIASEGYGWLDGNLYGNVFGIDALHPHGFALISATKYLFSELATGAYYADIDITTTDETWSKEQAKINNIIGEIPGASPTVGHEVILIAGHFDGQGTQPPDWLGRHNGLVYPSADDNGSGTAINMEIARALGNAYHEGSWTPKRTIRFLADNAEEEGVLGFGEYGYVLNARNEKVVACIYTDMNGGVNGNPNYCYSMLQGLTAYKGLQDIFKRAIANYTDPSGDKELYDNICVTNQVGMSAKFQQSCGWKEIIYGILQNNWGGPFVKDYPGFQAYNMPLIENSEFSTSSNYFYHTLYDNIARFDPPEPYGPYCTNTPPKYWMELMAKSIAAFVLELDKISSPLAGTFVSQTVQNDPAVEKMYKQLVDLYGEDAL